MGSDANRKRINWQTLGGNKAASAEKDFFEVFKLLFQGTDLKIEKQVKDFNDIYSKKEILSEKTKSQIYNPPALVKKNKKGTKTYPFGYKDHGIKPDFVIRNTKSKKSLYGEVKRQDGWVWNKPPNAGRGNAHERQCKLFTPGLLEEMRKKGNLKSKLPFWVVLIGDITKDPKRNREIAFWYKGVEDHFFMWRNQKDATLLVEHFEKNLKKFLV